FHRRSLDGDRRLVNQFEFEKPTFKWRSAPRIMRFRVLSQRLKQMNKLKLIVVLVAIAFCSLTAVRGSSAAAPGEKGGALGEKGAAPGEKAAASSSNPESQGGRQFELVGISTPFTERAGSNDGAVFAIHFTGDTHGSLDTCG